MAARDSDDDIRKYLPDLKTILREADPARAKEKLEKAQDNPELDAALAHAQRPSARPSAASLWAAEPAGIAAVGPVVVAPEVVARRRKRVPFPAWQKAIAAVIAVVGPVMLLWVLLVRPSGQEREGGRAGASAGSHVPAAPTTSAIASPIEPAPAPTAVADSGVSVAPLVPSVAVPTKPKGYPSTREDPYTAVPPRPAKTVDPVIPPPPPAPPAPTSSSWF